MRLSWPRSTAAYPALLLLPSILFLDALLLYLQGAHLTYTPMETVFLALLILNASLLILSFLTIRLLSVEPLTQLRRTKLIPSYWAIRKALEGRGEASVGLLVALLYALFYAWSVGLMVEAPLGPTIQVLLQGPPGYAPILVLFFTRGVGLLLPLYQLAALLALSALIFLSTACLIAGLRRGSLVKKGLGAGLAGATSALLVACPTCLTPPLLTLLFTYLAPWALSFGLGLLREGLSAVSIFLGSLLLLWLGLVVSSKALEGALLCPLRR